MDARLTAAMTEPAERSPVDPWQERAFALALALAGSILLFAVAFGLKPLWPAVAAGAVLVAGAAVSVRASLQRLDPAVRRQRVRSIAIAIVLAALVIMFYAATIVRLGGNVFNRPI